MPTACLYLQKKIILSLYDKPLGFHAFVRAHVQEVCARGPLAGVDAERLCLHAVEVA